jgi:hypothetical protein
MCIKHVPNFTWYEGPPWVKDVTAQRRAGPLPYLAPRNDSLSWYPAGLKLYPYKLAPIGGWSARVDR